MPTSVSLSQMVDLALGTPEVGAVNFNILHSLLHSMIRKLNITDVKGEINDSDRDFLQTVQSKQRAGAVSTISMDSGREDSEDGMSEKSFLPRRPPYHYLELKVDKIAEHLDRLNALPSDAQIMEWSQSKGDAERPLHDMWQHMQLKKRVDANEDGVGKLMSMFDNMLAEMQKLRSSQEDLQQKIKSLPNMTEWLERLKELEKINKELSEKFSLLPTPEEFSQFVTWPALEAALNGVREDLEKLSGKPERVVIEMSSQTDGPSRPASSRPLSGLSTASSGPSSELLDILEKLGSLSEDHKLLKQRVDDLEDQLKNKLDKESLENLNISADVLEQISALKAELDALGQAREKDSEALTRVQQALLQLQAEVEKIHNATEDLIEDNKERAKQIENLNNYCDTLHENKADKEFVAMEVDVKADKRSLDCKVNHSLFDSATNEINKLIKDLLDKLSGNEDTWKTAYKQLTEDIEGKLDRMELDPLKEWLESRLKALNKKILTQSKEWSEDDAAGIRKQLIQKFHCISCDRPVDMMPPGASNPTLPSQNGLPPTRSPRPYTTFELDQIRQHAKNNSFEATYLNPEISDYYATIRPCGGSHTMTYPHKRTTKLSNLSNLFKEEVEQSGSASTTVIPLYREEVDVQGQDGHIYKGRVERLQLEAKLPSVSATNNNAQVPAGGNQNQLYTPTPPTFPPPDQETQTRPMSSRMASRHQSEHQLIPDSSHTTPSPVFGEN